MTRRELEAVLKKAQVENFVLREQLEDAKLKIHLLNVQIENLQLEFRDAIAHLEPES